GHLLDDSVCDRGRMLSAGLCQAETAAPRASTGAVRRRGADVGPAGPVAPPPLRGGLSPLRRRPLAWLLPPALEPKRLQPPGPGPHGGPCRVGAPARAADPGSAG